MSGFRYRRRLFVVLAALVLVGILIASHFYWFESFSEQVKRSNQSVKSDVIDLTKKGHIEWVVSAESVPDLVSEILIINLSLDDTTNSRLDAGNVNRLKLALSVEAEAPGLTKTNRLIQTSFTPTSRPTDDRPNVWAGWGGPHAEYLLGYTTLFAYDKLKITLEVIEPDPRLAQAQPRLMVVPRYDSTVVGSILYFVLIRDLSIGIGVIALIFLVWCAWRSIEKIVSHQNP